MNECDKIWANDIGSATPWGAISNFASSAYKTSMDTASRAKERLAGYSLGGEKNLISYWGQEAGGQTDLIVGQQTAQGNIAGMATAAAIQNKASQQRNIIILASVGLLVVGAAIIYSKKK